MRSTVNRGSILNLRIRKEWLALKLATLRKPVQVMSLSEMLQQLRTLREDARQHTVETLISEVMESDSIENCEASGLIDRIQGAKLPQLGVLESALVSGVVSAPAKQDAA